jgi:hypothetical protein
MDFITAIANIFRPDFVFSMTFFIAFIGFGLFFNSQFWPWFKEYLNRKLEYDYQISAQRWEVLKALSDDLGEMKGTFSGFHENQRKILDILFTKHPPVS